MALVLTICCGLNFNTLEYSGSVVQQNDVRVSTLDTGWGTFDADFSADCCQVAVYAYRREPVNGLVQNVEQIQIWDYRRRKLVATKEVLRTDPHKDDRIEADPGFVRYGDSGHKLIAYTPEEGHLLLLNSYDFKEIQNIDLGKSAWPQVAPNPSGIHSYVSAIQIDRHGDRVAVALSWGAGVGGEVRLYSLTSHSLLRKWDFRNVSLGEISIDPNGHKVAVPLRPDRESSPERDVLVFDIDSGNNPTKINSGYVASAAAFVGSDTVATVSGELGLGAHKKDGIRFWDVKTGRLIREIQSPPNGIRYHLEVSGNGETVLGYVGKEVSHWWWFDPASFVTEYDKFRLWDLATGKVIATSPDVPPRSAYRLSPRGDAVLTHPFLEGGPVKIYEVP